MTGSPESLIGYTFKDDSLLTEALTHGSYIRDRSGIKDNQRLEFLGDALLDAIVGEEIYRRLPDEAEGTLTMKRAEVVRGETLSSVAKSIGLGEYILMSRGLENQGGRENASILEDAFEAVVGAVFVDGGYEKTKEVVLNLLEEYIESAMTGELANDYKSRLQEILQRRGEDAPLYRVTDEQGPSHDKTFYVEVLENDRVIGKGCGRSKKQAEQNAAREGIERIR